MPPAASRRRHRRRSAFALITSVLLLALVLSVAMQLVVNTSAEAVAAARQHRSLAHKLAVDSTLILLEESFANPTEPGGTLLEALDRDGFAEATYTIGDGSVHCRIEDDGAKFDPIVLQRPGEEHKLTRALETLMMRRELPNATVTLWPQVATTGEGSARLYHWYDQLLAGAEPGVLFRLQAAEDAAESQAVWSDAVTFWGNGRIDLRRVTPAVLESTLSDLRPGLAQQILARRPRNPAMDFTQSALTAVEAGVRAAVADRLSFDAKRYAIEMTTRVADESRRWYVVATITDSDMTIHHRSRITW